MAVTLVMSCRQPLLHDNQDGVLTWKLIKVSHKSSFPILSKRGDCMFKAQWSLRIIEGVVAVPQPSTTSLLYLVIFCFSKQNRGDLVPSDSMELTLVYNQVGSRGNSFQTGKPGLYGWPPLHVVVDSGSKFTGVLLSLLKIKKGRGYGSMWPHGAYICILPCWKPRQ